MRSKDQSVPVRTPNFVPGALKSSNEKNNYEIARFADQSGTLMLFDCFFEPIPFYRNRASGFMFLS